MERRHPSRASVEVKGSASYRAVSDGPSFPMDERVGIVISYTILVQMSCGQHAFRLLSSKDIASVGFRVKRRILHYFTDPG